MLGAWGRAVELLFFGFYGFSIRTEEDLSEEGKEKFIGQMLYMCIY